jgi:preflagellin peptidase FlaK
MINLSLPPSANPLVPLSFAVPLVFLALASIQDWHHREVSDWLWIGMLFSTAPLTLLRVLIGDVFLIDFVIAIIPTVIAIVLCESGFFGGADAKAIICIAFIVPTPPAFSQMFWPLHMNFALGVLTNAILLASLMAVYALCRNTPKVLTGGIEWEKGIRTWRKCLILVSSYFVSAEEFQRKKDFLSRVDPKRIFSQHNEESHQEQNRPPLSGQILVTPQLPLMIFVTVGYVLALIVGDVLSRLCLLLL